MQLRGAGYVQKASAAASAHPVQHHLPVLRAPLRNPCALRPSPLHQRRSAAPGQRRSMVASAAGPSDVYVLDFDGVLVDSEREVTSSAFAACKQRWPQIFGSLSADKEKVIAEGMRSVRPVLVRGYESMVMARMLAEEGPSAVDNILANGAWQQLCAERLAQWKEDPQDVANQFESLRNEVMKSPEWQAQQKPYNGAKDALDSCPYPFYIATSKAGHRVSPLLSSCFGLDIPPDSPRLFAALLPPDEAKANALEEICQRPLIKETGATVHFVDDRLETLKNIAARPSLSSIKLYLANWGYNTKAERDEANSMKNVRVIGQPQFIELLRFGIIMNVDDGCEPEEEEKAEAGLTASKPVSKYSDEE